MQIDYISDLHINHHIPFVNNQLKWEKRTKTWTESLMNTGTGKVLVLAGDFSEWNRQTIWFLEEASKHYEKVFFVTGNHDYYLLSKSQKEKYIDSKGRQAELIELASTISGVEPLIRGVSNYKGKVFAGDSLWYLPKTIEDWTFYKSVSNDSNFISVLNIGDYSSAGKEDQVRFLYKEALDWYDTLEGKHIDLMISHVPPVHPPISTYKQNALYDCPVPFLASDHWICGHQHIQGNFEKAGTSFWMNALGYPEEHLNFKLHTIVI